MNQWIKNLLGVVAGMAVIAIGDYLLGAKLEIFNGIATFTPVWVLDVFLVPFVSGMAVSRIVQTRNGKWLACLPPLFVRCLTYLYMYLYVFNDGKDFFYNLSLFYWGPMVILVVEFANLGGILGDVLAGSYRAKKAVPSDREG